MLDPNQNRDDQIHQMLECCLENEERLNDWERKFLDSITDQYDRNGDLSDLQIETLEKIYVKMP